MMARAMAGHRKAVAFALHRSLTLVDRWTHVPEYEGGDGESSPIERTETIIEALRKANAPEADLPLRWLCERLGYFAPIRIPNIAPLAALGDLSAVLKEVSDYVGAASTATADGEISLEEAERLLREADDLAQAVQVTRTNLAAYVVSLKHSRLRVAEEVSRG